MTIIQNNKFLKAIAVIVACLFLFNTNASAVGYVRDNAVRSDTLNPALRTASGDFRETYKAVAVCRFIEKNEDLVDPSSVEHILSSMTEIKDDLDGIHFKVLPNEVIIEIPDEGLAVRYFDPNKANILTPYSDISKLRTKLISNRLNRQIIHRPKALTSDMLPETPENRETLSQPEAAEEVKKPKVRSKETIEAYGKLKGLFSSLDTHDTEEDRKQAAHDISMMIIDHRIDLVTPEEMRKLLNLMGNSIKNGDTHQTVYEIRLGIMQAPIMNPGLMPVLFDSYIEHKANEKMKKEISDIILQTLVRNPGTYLDEEQVHVIIDSLKAIRTNREDPGSLIDILYYVLLKRKGYKIDSREAKEIIQSIILMMSDVYNDARRFIEVMLHNDPSVMGAMFEVIAEASPLENVHFLIDSIDGFIQNVDFEPINKDALSALKDIKNPEYKVEVFRRIIEPLFFRQRDLFTEATLRELEENYSEDVPDFKYLLSYADMAGIYTSDKIRTGFPYREKVNKRLLTGKQKVLIINNIRDGLGDELIRYATIMQALVDANPELEITYYTHRPFLIDHPRISTREISEGSLDSDEKYTMIMNCYDPPNVYFSDGFLKKGPSEGSNEAWEKEFQEYLSHNKPFIYINMDKSHDDFYYKDFLIQGKKVAMPEYDQFSRVKDRENNAYTPCFHLCSILGLEFRSGTERSERSIFTSADASHADVFWEEHVKKANMENRPVVIINGFGGEDEKKGYRNNDKGKESFRKDISSVISQGFFVLLLPNGKYYGTSYVAQEVVEGLSEADQEKVIVAPDPSDDPTLYKHLLERPKIAFVLTVEGGMVHFAYNTGVPFGVLRKEKSGALRHWVPLGIDNTQGVIGITDSYRGSEGVIREQIIPEVILDRSFGNNRTNKPDSSVDPERIYDAGTVCGKYIDKNREIFRDLADSNKKKLLRIPVEILDTVFTDEVGGFLQAFQKGNGYIELFYMSGLSEADGELYKKYGLTKKSLPEGFEKERENTITLMPVLKGENVDQTVIMSRLGSLNIAPTETILVPIGIQNDSFGLIRTTILGMQIMRLAGYLKTEGKLSTRDQELKDRLQLEILEELKNICPADDIKDVNITPDDIIKLASGTINDVINALNKLIKLLPIEPIDTEEQRKLYLHAKKVMLAA